MIRRALLLSAAVTLLCWGCAGQKQEQAASTVPTPVEDDRSIEPLTLPDLSSAAASVRTQITDQYARVTSGAASGSQPDADLAREYGELGTMLMAAEFNDAARIALRHAQRLAPADARWPYYLGHLGKTMGDLDTSAAAFERALALQPSNEATLVSLADVYFDQGRPSAAGPLFTKALAGRADSMAALVGLGRIALAGGDFSTATTHLESAIALDPRPSTTHYHLAMAYRGLGQRDRAESHLARATTLEIGPRDPWMDELNGRLESGKAYQYRGLQALDAGRWSDAAALFTKGIALEPDSPWLHHGLGTALFQLKDPAGALEHFNASVRRSPAFARGHYSAGVVLAFGGRRPDAVKRFSAAIAANPQYVEAHLALADTLRETGQATDALRLYERTLAIDPRSAEGHFGAAMALVQLGRHRDARDRLSSGAAVFPNQPEFTHALARLLAASNDDTVRDGQRAMALMPRLLELPPRFEVTETMAMVLAENGKVREAVSWQREAMAAAAREGQAMLVDRMQGALRAYETGRPSRTPWRDGEQPWLGQP